MKCSTSLKVSVWLLAGLILTISSNVALAEPFLQLDFAGGYWDPVDQTVYSPGNRAFLYALINPKKNTFIAGDTYFIAASITPKQAQVDPDFGSFEFAGNTFSVGNMDYGSPMGQPHGIFPTYYKEFGFDLSAGKTAALYDSQVNPGGLVTLPNGPMYYEEFFVDVGGMNHGYGVHFDLYTLNPYKFAPFSHDAVAAPVPGAFLLGSLGLGFASWRLRRRRTA